MATCPHCNKVILVKLTKDTSATAAPKSEPAADTSAIGELLDMIDDDSLTGKAVDFIAQTRERFKKYKDNTRMSEAQMNWLRNIAMPESEEF